MVLCSSEVLRALPYRAFAKRRTAVLAGVQSGAPDQRSYLASARRATTGVPALRLARRRELEDSAKRPLAASKRGPGRARGAGCVPAPAEKQGIRANRDDGVQAAGVVRPRRWRNGGAGRPSAPSAASVAARGSLGSAGRGRAVRTDPESWWARLGTAALSTPADRWSAQLR